MTLKYQPTVQPENNECLFFDGTRVLPRTTLWVGGADRCVLRRIVD